MEFLPHNSFAQPKNLYPCLATITITPTGGDKQRRLSTSSGHSGDNAGKNDDDNILKRIASGGRRKSDAASHTPERRKSFVAQPMVGAGGVEHHTPDKGTWYWRVQAGVTDNALILLPLTQPANPVLTSAPQPLSQAMPAHSAKANPHSNAASGDKDNEDGLIDKVKNLFRRNSSVPHADSSATHASNAGTAGPAGTGSTPGGDKVIDQTAQGEQLPSAAANAIGATNVNANAETGWPGVVSGEKLQAIAVPLGNIERGKVGLSKKGDGYYVTVPVTSHFAAMTAGFSGSGPSAKAGVLKLEFDKDWIGAKAESEILHNQILNALEAEQTSIAGQSLQLGSPSAGSPVSPSAGHNHPALTGVLPTSHPNPGMEERLSARRASQVAPPSAGQL